MTEQDNELIHLTIDVVTAFVGQNTMRPEDVPALIATVHKAVAALQAKGADSPVSTESDVEEVPAEYIPAVTVRKSLGSREHILSMIDGKPYKTLKRHLGQHGLTPAQYRERYGLKSDYPMVAPAYSEARKAMALQIGLGQRGGDKARAAKAAPAPKLISQAAAEAPAITAKAVTPAKVPVKRAAAPSTKAAGKAPAKTAPKVSRKAAAKGVVKASGDAAPKRGRPPKAIANSAAVTAE